MRALRKIGIAFLILAIVPLFLTIWFLSKSEVTTGIISDISSRRNGTQYISEQKGSVYPCKLSISFKHRDMPVAFQTIGERRPCSPFFSVGDYYYIGQAVLVRYHSNDPSSARLNDLVEIWGPTLFFVSSGMFLVGVTIIIPHFTKSIKFQKKRTK